MTPGAEKPDASPSRPDSSDPATDVSALLRNLWRALVRATRAAEHLPALPESQVDALRVLAQSGSMTPGELAEALRLARPTVSNLLKDLGADGMIERQRSSIDGRSAIVVPTDDALAILAAFSRARVEVLQSAFSRMTAYDLEKIDQAIPALHQLLAELEKADGTNTTL